MRYQDRIHIGTSGWHYAHWTGTFYPEGTKDSEQLACYLQHFKTVELNNSFYNLPLAKTFKNWKAATPGDFIFAVKASRYITHMKKLKVDKETLDKFFRGVSKLGDKLGPVLFQLPPRWKVNAGRLARFLEKLPGAYRYTFEFRNAEWYNDEIYDMLEKHNCAFCIYALAGHMSPMKVTADFAYIRLHGPGEKYQGSYTPASLRKWASTIVNWAKAGKEVFVYFDNDQAGYAALNAEKLYHIVNTGRKPAK